MSKNIRINLLVAMVPLLLAEGLMIYPVFFNGFPTWQLLAPVSLLTLFPMWSLQDAMQDGSYYGITFCVFIDVLFISVMAFSIIRNYEIVGSLCLLTFILFSMASVAAGY